MKRCSVPRCKSKTNLRGVPFTDKSRWMQWKDVFPHFHKYNRRQLENVKICNNHFLPRHIDERGRLTKDAIPCRPLSQNITEKNKLLELFPLEHDEPVFIQIVDIKSVSQDEQAHAFVLLRAGDESGLPVDHDKYCLSSQSDGPPVGVSSFCTTSQVSIELVPEDDNTVLNNTGQEQLQVPPDHTATASPLPWLPLMSDEGEPQPLTVNINARSLLHKERGKGIPVDSKLCGSASVPSQTTDMVPSHNDRLPQSLSTNIGYSVENWQPGTLDNGRSEHHTEYILPEDSPKPDVNIIWQSGDNIDPDVLKILIEKSPIAQDYTLFSAHKEQYSLPVGPFPHIPTVPLAIQKLDSANHAKHNNTSTYNQLPSQKQTLESIIVELTDCVTAKNMTELDCAKIRTAILDKENSTPTEKLLHMHIKMLQIKMNKANCRIRKLKKKSDTLLAKTKEYLKNYKRLSPQEKLLVDVQLRLARTKRKGARFTEEEKMFALKLYKISPECYTFLQTYVKLPSHSTVNQFIKTVL